MKIRRILLLSVATCAISAPARVVLAADNDKKSDNATEVGAVIITAEKREQKLQDVPVAVTVISSKERSDLRITTLQDLTNYTPGFVYSTSLDRAYIRGVGTTTNFLGTDAGVAIYNDGFYNASTTAASAPPLFQADEEVLRGPQGTLYGRNSIGGAINITSLKPSRTYTAEVDATVANYDHQTLSATTSGPLTDWLRFRAGVSNDRQTQGFFTNVAGGPSEGGVVNNWYYEGQLAAELGPHIDATLRYDTASWDERRRFSTTNIPYCTAPVTFFGGGSPGFFQPSTSCQPSFSQASIPATVGYGVANPGVTNPFAFNTDTPSHDTLKGDNDVILNVTYHANAMDIHYIYGYHDSRYNQTGDGDNTSRGAFSYSPPFGQPAVTLFPVISGIYDTGESYSSHEIDFTSTDKSRLQWIGGLYYFNEISDLITYSQSPGQTQLLQPAFFVGGCGHTASATPSPSCPNGAAYDPSYSTILPTGPSGTGSATPPPNPGAYYNYQIQTLASVSYAAFGQLDYAVTDTVKATVGIRYNVDQKAGTEDQRDIGFAPGQYNYPFSGGTYSSTDYTPSATCPAASTVPYKCTVLADGSGRKLSQTWKAWSGTAKLSWQPDKDTLAYISYSRGYKSGGFDLGESTLPGGFVATENLKPETLDDYEVGLKKTFFRTLTLDGVIYYYDYQNEQDQNFQTDPVSGTSETISVNFPHVREYGAELEAVWNPTRQWNFIASYSYEHARIGTDSCINADTPPFSSTIPTKNCVFDALTGTFKDVNNAIAQATPANKISVTGDYTFNFDPGDLTLSATYNWRDGNYSSFFNEAAYFNPAYGELDARAIWNSADKKYSVNAFVSNVSNSKAAEYRYPFLVGATVYIIPQIISPRTYGVELRYKFG